MPDHLGSFHMSSSSIQVAVRQVEDLPKLFLLFGDPSNFVLMVLGLALLPSTEEVIFRYREHYQGKRKSWMEIGHLMSPMTCKKEGFVYLHWSTMCLIPTYNYPPMRRQVTEESNGVFKPVDVCFANDLVFLGVNWAQNHRRVAAKEETDQIVWAR